MRTTIGSLALAVITLATTALLPIPARSADVTTAGKEFVELLTKQNFAAAVTRYDASMKAALPEEKLRETWQTIQSQAGRFQKQVRARTEKLQGHEVAL